MDSSLAELALQWGLGFFGGGGRGGGLEAGELPVGAFFAPDGLEEEVVVGHFAAGAFGLVDDAVEDDDVGGDDVADDVGGFKAGVAEAVDVGFDVDGFGFEVAVAVGVAEVVGEDALEGVGVGGSHGGAASFVGGHGGGDGGVFGGGGHKKGDTGEGEEKECFHSGSVMKGIGSVDGFLAIRANLIPCSGPSDLGLFFTFTWGGAPVGRSAPG
jgi:hypothetical protein